MAKLKIYEYPDPVLKQKAAPVEKVDDGLRRLLDDMLETRRRGRTGRAAGRGFEKSDCHRHP